MSGQKDLSFIDDIKELAAMPKISTDIMTMFQDASKSWKEIAEKIKLDPALALFILKTSNSPFYGIKHEIRTIENAIKMLGLPEIKSILMSFFLRNLYLSSKESAFMDDLWEHSISVAVFANELSSFLNIKKEEVYLAGLLHDIGKLVIHLHAPDEYAEIIDKADDLGEELTLLEEEAFNFTHIDTGYYLLEKWNFSEYLKNAVLFHHFFISYRGDDPIVGMVAFANELVRKYIDGKPAPLDIYLKHYGLAMDDVDSFAEKTVGITEGYHLMMARRDPKKKRRVQEKETQTPAAPSTPSAPSPPPAPPAPIVQTDLMAKVSTDTPYDAAQMFLHLDRIGKGLEELKKIFPLFDEVPLIALQNHEKMLKLFTGMVNSLLKDPKMALKLNLSPMRPTGENGGGVIRTAADEVAHIMEKH
ncbi:MAG: HDOD domain-containing protein [bacterium]|nr:HDOD domain-containing protein [bacterium]